MPKQKQLKLFEFKTKTAFGGTLNRGKRKETRPLDSKRPAHLIFKAGRDDLLLAHRELVEAVLTRNAQKFGVRIRSLGTNADHIHIVIEFANREIYTKWVRAVTGVLARKIKGLSWKLLPYTEIVNWGRHLRTAENYVEKNRKEAQFILECHSYVDDHHRMARESVGVA